MMMDRRHGEDAFSGELETQHLENDRDRFDHEHPANNRKQKLLFTTNRDDTDHSANRERAGVTHENARRMTIEPEKSETGADERTAKHGQLAGKRIEWHLQIFSDPVVARGVGKQRVGKRNGNRATRSETVETVGKIDGIR